MTEALRIAEPASEPAGERHRRGGRAGKRAVDAGPFEQPRFQQYRRHIQPTAYVSEDELESIHLASLRVLRDIGVDVLHDEARRIMKTHGADVREGELRVRFDSDMILGLIAHAPPEFTIHARNPAHNLRFGGDTVIFAQMAHNPTRHCFVATDGPVVLFDYFSCEHLSDHSGVVDEVRPAISWMYLYGGELTDRRVARWAAGIADLVRQHGGGNRRIAVDHLNPEGVAELARLGIEIGNGEVVMENARLIESPDEILAMRRAIVACEAAMAEMQVALRPGILENELWAELHRGNIARGGEWIETRLLSSGPRTNPWFQECSSRIIEDGDLVAFDTDLIGPYGFCADLSRTWLCGDKPATSEQRELFRIAAGQIAHNTELMRPGISFRQLVERSQTPPPDCFPTRYGVLYHGVGLADEYPTLPHAADWTDDTPDGELEPGMVLCVESYIGRLGGHEGVKIEEQVLITETGNQTLSTYPLDERLL